MKNIYIKFIHRLLVLLGFATLSSCEDLPFGDVPAEYGTPNAEFALKIKVTDQQDNPIKGIRVAVRTGFVSHLDNGPTDTLYTSDDGRYAIDKHLIRMYDHISLKFEDIDGEQNGGNFKSQEISPEIVRTEEGDGHWYQGKYEASADVVLVRED